MSKEKNVYVKYTDLVRFIFSVGVITLVGSVWGGVALRFKTEELSLFGFGISSIVLVALIFYSLYIIWVETQEGNK